MNSRQRNVLVRMLIALGVFIYIGYLARQQLPAFDFKVVVGFVILYLMWTVISEVWIYKDPGQYVIEDDDQRSYVYLQLSYNIGLFFAAIDFVGWHITRIKSLEPYVIYAGIVLFLLSCWIRWWGFNSIGKYFNPRVAIYEEHPLITTGAYKKIRHPLYLGTLVSFISIPLVLNSWGALLIMCCLTIPALIYRIKVEESFMIKHFGDDYIRYMENTRRLFPGIW
ncbi:MAG TPA: isoprenylcysteine carboxylmethyltransferase family protein [Syntrophomonadaceae bacterium]|nr:isoprenylcysteine carboxylmethyltransferase family protein [Syntrophomonadaceae bacterium]